ncbi:MAG: alpha/beta fold hydrolase [Gemmatimonadetes bacterium]|nr:alpha/beta fold hydrolase [Gemmatimonadota bacterium]
MLTLLAALAVALLGPRPGDGEVHRVVLAPGDTVVATSEGMGMAIVFVPGLVGNSYGFRKVVPALADSGYRTVIVEPLGTGNSSHPRQADYTLEAQARRVAETMNRLDIPDAYLVCHSVGASICLRLALLEPDRVRGVLSINGGPDEHAGTNGLRTAIRLAPLLKLFGAGRIIRGKVKGGMKKNSADPAWVTDDVVAAYTEPFRNADAALRAFRAMSQATEPDSLRPRLPDVAAPVRLLVGGGSAEGAPAPAGVAVLAAGLRQFTADTIRNAGQYIHEEQPDSVVAAVQRLVRGAVPPVPAEGR